MNALLGFVQSPPGQAVDPVRSFVLQFLASYGGLAAGVAFLTSGLKWAARRFVEGREPLAVIILTFLVGSAAKIALPTIYGGSSLTDWTLHEVILLFVAVGAQTFHDKAMNPILGKFAGGAVPPPKSPPKTPEAP